MTRFTLGIDAEGKVVGCQVTGSSGHPVVDETACNLLKRRARFTPAMDSSGTKVASSYSSRFRWEIPAE